MSLYLNPRQFQNDEKGRSAPYATLDFYDTATFDRKNTYSDIGLTSPLPNPVVADAAGRFPKIYLAVDSAYRVVYSERQYPREDAPLTPVWTEDDVWASLAANSSIQAFDSIADLPAVTVGKRISTAGYYSGTTVGGIEDGIGVASARHDGVIYFDPDRSSEIGTAAYYVDSGSDVPCWERVVTGSVTAYMAGAIDSTIADSTPAFTALRDLQKSTGVSISATSGAYLIDGVLFDYDDAAMSFVGDVHLYANSNNAILFHQSASFANHSGTFFAHGNGKSNVTVLACAPSDLADTATLYQVNHNQMPGAHADNEIEIHTLLQNGPQVGGSDSGCFYNVFPFGRGRGATGMILLNDSADLVNGPPCNRNRFYNYRLGTGGGVSGNYGVRILAGDTNSFVNCDFEGVGSGASKPGPMATPTAVVIEQTSASGFDNNHNEFIGGTCEANTRDMDIRTTRAYFIGFGYQDSKSVFPNGYPAKRITARDSSASNCVINGFRAIDDVNTVWDGDSFGDAVTKNTGTGRYNWATYPLNTTTVSQGGSLIPAVAQNSSFYRKVFGIITWHFRLAFTANTAGDPVVIPLPLAAQNALYVAPGSAQTMKFPLRISDGTTEQLWYAEINGANLEIPSPGAWNTASNVNAIWAQIEYHDDL